MHTLHYITLQYITLHYITLHYITLHYIHTYIRIYIYIHVHIWVCFFLTFPEPGSLCLGLCFGVCFEVPSLSYTVHHVNQNHMKRKKCQSSPPKKMASFSTSSWGYFHPQAPTHDPELQPEHLMASISSASCNFTSHRAMALEESEFRKFTEPERWVNLPRLKKNFQKHHHSSRDESCC